MPTIICPQLSLVSFQSWWTCLGMTLGMSSFPKKPAFFTFNLAQIDLFLQQRKPIVIGHTGEKVNLLNIHFCLPIQFSLRPDWQCISELLWNPSCVGLLVLAALGITWRAFGYPGARAFRRSMLFCFVLFLETGFLSVTALAFWNLLLIPGWPSTHCPAPASWLLGLRTQAPLTGLCQSLTLNQLSKFLAEDPGGNTS